jgi:hypothetical protein
LTLACCTHYHIVRMTTVKIKGNKIHAYSKQASPV